jgi:hypothetical protein
LRSLKLFLLVRVCPERRQDLADRAASEEREEHVFSRRLADPEPIPNQLTERYPASSTLRASTS